MNFIIILIYVATFIVSWLLLYYVVKAAIKNAIIESRSQAQPGPGSWSPTPDIKPTDAHVKLQDRYEKGEISFDTYQREWKKL